VQKYMIEARQLLALAIPVIVAQVAQTAMGFVDTVMAGGYSATDMAAVAIGTSIWLPAILFGHGLLLALTPVIAQLNGSGRRDRVAHQVRQGFWLAGFVSVLIMIVLWNAGYIIRAMHNIDPALADKAVGYLRALLWGAPGYLFFQVARNQCEGLAKTKPGMVMGFIGLLVNIPVNYIFIYGHFGMPELGGVGCGVATAAVYWVMFFSMLTFVKRARSMRDIGQRANVAQVGQRVGRRLGEHQPCLGPQRRLPCRHIGLRHESRLHAEARELAPQQLDGRAEHRLRAHDVVARFEQREAHQQDGRHAGRRGDGAFRALHGGQPAFKGGHRGIASTGVSEALLLARKASGRRGGVRLHEAAGEIQRLGVLTVGATGNGFTHRQGIGVQARGKR